MTREERDEPPTIARVGAERWTRRKVVMNGAEPCARFVKDVTSKLRYRWGRPGRSGRPGVS